MTRARGHTAALIVAYEGEPELPQFIPRSTRYLLTVVVQTIEVVFGFQNHFARDVCELGDAAYEWRTNRWAKRKFSSFPDVRDILGGLE